jgi:hypothetical protein
LSREAQRYVVETIAEFLLQGGALSKPPAFKNGGL